MLLTSFSFGIFLTITLLIYFIVPKKFKWLILLISSFIFLFYNNFKLNIIIYILIILLVAYICAILIDKYKDTKKAKLFLIIGILTILGVLIYLKYTNLILVTISHLFAIFHNTFNYTLVSRDVPIGISYYSLIMIGYLVDVYRNVCKPEKNILKCALFMSYFPILTSGPFIRYNDMKDKLYNGHKLRYDNLCHGLVRILWGLFKILVISQRLSIFVNAVYGNYITYNGLYIVLAACFFVLQLYTNFSGSIDIIMGVSKIINIDLPENFNSPFFSRTITEFWRNWHITLGSWLRDYVFYPLMKSNFIQSIGIKSKKIFGKKVSKKIMLYISMIIMWTLIGFWHNGAYTFIIGSGLLQCLYMILEDLLEPLVKKINNKLGINEDTFGYKLYQCIRTFLLFSFSMIFFSATSVSNAIDIIKNMFVWNPWILLDNTSLYALGLDILDFRILIISLIILFVVDYINKTKNVIDELFKQNLVFRWLVIYSLIFMIVIFGMYGPGYDPTVFIYREF